MIFSSSGPALNRNFLPLVRLFNNLAVTIRFNVS